MPSIDEILNLLAEHKLIVLIGGALLLLFGNKIPWADLLAKVKSLVPFKGDSTPKATAPLEAFFVLREHLKGNAQADPHLKGIWQCLGDPPAK